MTSSIINCAGGFFKERNKQEQGFSKVAYSDETARMQHLFPPSERRMRAVLDEKDDFCEALLSYFSDLDKQIKNMV